jgi:hypothetical protein
MKTISGKIFTAKVSVERVQEDGLAKKVKEEYAVKAVNFTDCEAKLTKELASAENVKKSFDVLVEAVAPYSDVYVFDEGETFYKVKVQETYIDDYGKEKKNNYYHLVNATSFEQARKNIVEVYGGSMKDYTIAAIVEQNILEVIE